MVCYAPLHTPYLHCILSYAIVSVAIQYGRGYLDEERKMQINFPTINGSGVQWQSSPRRQPTASVLELNDFNLFWQLRNRGTLENESLVPVTKGFLSPHQRISTDWLEHS